MNVHYYGILDNLESCYTYQTFNIDGVTLLLQNAPRFGYKPATLIIKDPAMFIKKKDGFYRFVIENYKVEVENGVLIIDESKVREIISATSILFL